MTGWLAVVATGLSTALLVAGPPRLAGAAAASPAPSSSSAAAGPLLQWRWLWALLAGLGAAVVLDGVIGGAAGVAAAATVWVVAGRAEPRDARRRREEIARDLPHVVALLGAALHAGAAPADAIAVVGRALPGAAADQLRPVAARLALGADPTEVWESVGQDAALGSLGRTMARTHRTGAPVVVAVDRLADELAARVRGDAEDRARTVGVRAAVPLGLCLLPSFLLLGIVPLAAGLIGTLRL